MPKMTNEFYEEIDKMLFILLELTNYYLSPYYKDQIIQFINAGEEGLAFEALIYPYYEGRHTMSPEVENIINILSNKMDITLPNKKII